MEEEKSCVKSKCLPDVEKKLSKEHHNKDESVKDIELKRANDEKQASTTTPEVLLIDDEKSDDATLKEKGQDKETLAATTLLDASNKLDECDFNITSPKTVPGSSPEIIHLSDDAPDADPEIIHLPQAETKLVELKDDDGNKDDDDDDDDDEEYEDNGEYFVLRTFEEVKKLIEDYSDRTSSHFVVQKKTKTFASNLKTANFSNYRVQWHEVRLATGVEENTFANVMDYDGIPHIIFGAYTLGCQFGLDSSASQKKRRQEMKDDGRLNVRSRILKTPSKKCGCPAKIVVKQIIRFPDYKVAKDTVRRKANQSTSLRERLRTDVNGLTMDVYYVGRLAHEDEHKYHNDEVGFHKEDVHRDLVYKAQELYLQGLNCEQILAAINTYVIGELFWKRDPPDPNRRRFRPKAKDIRNFIARIRQLSRFTPEEEEKINKIVNDLKKNLQNKVDFYIKEEKVTDSDEDKQPDSLYDDFFEFESDAAGPPKVIHSKKREDKFVWQNFVFCFQTRSQQRLLSMYGGVTYLTELELRSTLRSILPYRCYLLLVQTNVDYQAVGFIAVSKQKKNGLVESLKIFQRWNSFWHPKYVFVDYIDTMFEAISAIFPDADKFLNLHSCENKWLEFINTPSNDLIEDSEEIISFLRGMQFSLTEEALTKTASLFEGSEVWQKNEKLRQWFQEKWLPLAKCWVYGYRPEDLIVMQHMNMTAIDCINIYREDILCALRGDGLFEILHKVCTQIPKEQYEEYSLRNNKINRYNGEFQKGCKKTVGLQGIPPSLLPYCVCMHTIENIYDIEEVAEIGMFGVSCGPEKGKKSNNIDSFENEFSSIQLLNKDEHGRFNVSFGNATTFPFCTCAFWNTYRLPCAHMMAIFATVPGWAYHMLSPLYRNLAVLSVDYSVLDRSLIMPNDKECQTVQPKRFSMGTQVNRTMDVVFQDVSKLDVTQEFCKKVKRMTDDISNASDIFSDPSFFRKIRFEFRRFYASVMKEMERKVKTNNVAPTVYAQSQHPQTQLKISATKFNEIAQHNDKIILENASKNLVQGQKPLLNIAPDLTKLNEIAQHNDKIILDKALKTTINGEKIKISTDLSKLNLLGNKSKIILVDESGKFVPQRQAAKRTEELLDKLKQKKLVLIDGRSNPKMNITEAKAHLKAINRVSKTSEVNSKLSESKSEESNPLHKLLPKVTTISEPCKKVLDTNFQISVPNSVSSACESLPKLALISEPRPKILERNSQISVSNSVPCVGKLLPKTTIVSEPSSKILDANSQISVSNSVSNASKMLPKTSFVSEPSSRIIETNSQISVPNSVSNACKLLPTASIVSEPSLKILETNTFKLLPKMTVALDLSSKILGTNLPLSVSNSVSNVRKLLPKTTIVSEPSSKIIETNSQISLPNSVSNARKLLPKTTIVSEPSSKILETNSQISESNSTKFEPNLKELFKRSRHRKDKKKFIEKLSVLNELKYITPEQNLEISGTELGKIKYIGHQNNIIPVDDDDAAAAETTETNIETSEEDSNGIEANVNRVLNVMRLNKKLTYLKLLEEHGLTKPPKKDLKEARKELRKAKKELRISKLKDKKLSAKLSSLKSKDLIKAKKELKDMRLSEKLNYLQSMDLMESEKDSKDMKLTEKRSCLQSLDLMKVNKDLRDMKLTEKLTYLQSMGVMKRNKYLKGMKLSEKLRFIQSIETVCGSETITATSSTSLPQLSSNEKIVENQDEKIQHSETVNQMSSDHNYVQTSSTSSVNQNEQEVKIDLTGSTTDSTPTVNQYRQKLRIRSTTNSRPEVNKKTRKLKTNMTGVTESSQTNSTPTMNQNEQKLKINVTGATTISTPIVSQNEQKLKINVSGATTISTPITFRNKQKLKRNVTDAKTISSSIVNQIDVTTETTNSVPIVNQNEQKLRINLAGGTESSQTNSTSILNQNEQRLKINLTGATEPSQIKQKMDQISKFDALNANEVKLHLNKHIPDNTNANSPVNPNFLTTLFNFSVPTSSQSSTKEKIKEFTIDNKSIIIKRPHDVSVSSSETEPKKQKISPESSSEKIITGIVLNQKNIQSELKLALNTPHSNLDVSTVKNSPLNTPLKSTLTDTENIHFSINDSVPSDPKNASQTQKIVIDLEAQTDTNETDKQNVPLADVFINVDEEIQLECDENVDLDFKDDIKEGGG